MPPTRRTFLKHSIEAAAGLLVTIPSCTAEASDRPAVLVNHVGFTPFSSKFCLQKGTRPIAFAVAEAGSGRIVHRGMMKPVKGDMGDYVLGDLGNLDKSGPLVVHADGGKSASILIKPDIYTPALRKCIDYFSKQRCGDSHSGYRAPCHLDDGRRRDNGQLQDVTGGWHDACDARKWVIATIYGMFGLSRVLDVLKLDGADQERIVDEMRWGNQYFQKMQEPAGYVMNYCGGDDGNNFTDNKKGTDDDRLIHVEPCDLPAQFHFITAQAAMIRYTRDKNAVYARQCEAAAERCLKWCVEKRLPGAAASLSAAVIACVQLHRASGGDYLQDWAAGYAHKLILLQEINHRDAAAVRGFFRSAPDQPRPYREIMHGNLPLLALCEALEYLPGHADADKWRKALELHADHLVRMCGRSAFGTVPFGVYTDGDPGGNRHIGDYWYRWFMKPHGEYKSADWWVGINAHLASNGVGLIRASRLLKDSRLASLAQRQLDWILGVNPFNASTVTGVGHNQPPLFVTGEFAPPTPLIPGGVMCGLGGSPTDAVRLYPGSYHTCEYWTPMVAYTMWLMAELQANGRA